MRKFALMFSLATALLGAIAGIYSLSSEASQAEDESVVFFIGGRSKEERFDRMEAAIQVLQAELVQAKRRIRELESRSKD